MTPPPNKWLFFPTPVASGVKFQLDATLSTSPKFSATRFNISSGTFSGTDDVSNNYELYTSQPIRKSTTYIELLVSIQTDGDYSDAGTWETAVTNASGLDNATSTWTHDGADFGSTSVTHTHGSNSGSILRIRWNGSSTDVTNFWNTMAAGEVSTIKMNWT